MVGEGGKGAIISYGLYETISDEVLCGLILDSAINLQAWRRAQYTCAS